MEMAGEKRRTELTDEELERQIGAALPDREATSLLPLGDPGAGEIASIVDDSEPDEPPAEPS
jgi:hypothetical protein